MNGRSNESLNAQRPGGDRGAAVDTLVSNRLSNSTAAGSDLQAKAEAIRLCTSLGLPEFLLPPGAKVPLKDSHGFYDATLDADALIADLRRHPGRNLAIATGHRCAAGGYLITVDVDTPHEPGGLDGRETWRDLEAEHGTVPATPQNHTPRDGTHYLFTWPTPLRSATAVWPGIDVRGALGYIVAPPSTTRDGVYVFDAEFHLADMPIAELPAWAAEAIEAAAPSTPGGGGQTFAAPVGDIIPSGKRDATLTSMAGTMRRRGFETDEIDAALLVTNAKRCRPPLPERDVHRIAASIGSRPTEAADPQLITHSNNGHDDTKPPVDPDDAQTPDSVNNVNSVEGAHKTELGTNLSLQNAPWQPPVPLGAPALPPFPVGVFPSWIGDYVGELSTALQVPPDLPAVLALGAISTAVARRVEARPRDGWTEPVNIYADIVAPPGERKSATQRAMVAPIAAFEWGEVQRLAASVAESKAERVTQEAKLAHLQRQAAKGEDEAEAIRALARGLALTEAMVLPQLIVDDVTPERIVGILADQEGRISILSAEADVFDIMGGRYSDKPNFGVFLRGHSGDDIRVDRVGRAPQFVSRPAITMVVCSQPEVVEGLTQTPGFRGRGLLARILYSWPRPAAGERCVRAKSASEAARVAYHTGITKLLTVEAATDAVGRPVPHVVGFAPTADDALAAWETELEPQLSEFGTLGHIADWAAKLAGATVRLATLLHLADHAHDARPWSQAVPESTVERAITMARYFLAHALRAFGAMGADPTLAAAERVLRWIRDNGREMFSRRDLHVALQGDARFGTSASLGAPLTVLIGHGYIRRVPRVEGVGRPSELYSVSPFYKIDTIDKTDGGTP